MESLLAKEEKRGVNRTFIIAIVIALALIGIVVFLLSRTPPADQRKEKILASAFHEGDPEFKDLSKDIIIATDDRTVESPTGLGTISMFIRGNIHNKGDRTIDILEVNVSVITQFNEVIKEKRMLVIPVQQPSLGPGQDIPVTLTIDGFSKNDDRANIRWKVTAAHAAQ
jgi:hypothetical protein